MQKKNGLFKKKVLDIVAHIPKGETMTYKEVATQAGNGAASRVVGNIMAKNYDPAIPCHRVIQSSGELGGYNRGVERKRTLLTEEGAL